jgi:phosphotriesterase-related protein
MDTEMAPTHPPIASVMTVTGPVTPGALGVTLMHEHIRVTFPGTELEPRYHFDRAAFLRKAAERFKVLVDHGVRTFVDPSPIELGRDVAIMKELSEKTGINIIASTGFYTERVGIPGYWRIRSVEDIAELFIREIETGIGTTDIRAGTIKCATSGPDISELERRVLKAAALAHLKTGAPIITHNESDVGAIEQQKLLASYGVEPHRCLIGHCSNSADPRYHLAVVQGGTFIGFDRIGMPHRGSDEIHAENIAKLFQAGYGGQVIISQDRYVEFGGKPYRELSPAELAETGRYERLFTTFVPMLRAAGLKAENIDQLLIGNPAAFFSGSRGGEQDA